MSKTTCLTFDSNPTHATTNIQNNQYTFFLFYFQITFQCGIGPIFLRKKNEALPLNKAVTERISYARRKYEELESCKKGNSDSC